MYAFNAFVANPPHPKPKNPQTGYRFMEYHVEVASELVDAINGIIVIALALPEIVAIIRRRHKS